MQGLKIYANNRSENASFWRQLFRSTTEPKDLKQTNPGREKPTPVVPENLTGRRKGNEQEAVSSNSWVIGCSAEPLIICLC